MLHFLQKLWSSFFFDVIFPLFSVCTKYFERADKSCAEDKTLEPDVYLDLEDKDGAWEKLMELCL